LILNIFLFLLALAVRLVIINGDNILNLFQVMPFASARADIKLNRTACAKIIKTLRPNYLDYPSLLPLHFPSRQMKKSASLIKAVLRFRQHYFSNPAMESVGEIHHVYIRKKQFLHICKIYFFRRR